MSEFEVTRLLDTDAVNVRTVHCRGSCRQPLAAITAGLASQQLVAG